MFHIALYQPEIPPNTGNIIRLCANIGAQLHLIKPYGFILDDKRLRRAGLDYREWMNLKQHDNLDAFYSSVEGQRIFACSTRGKNNYAAPQYQKDDVFLFGPETRGLPGEVLESLPSEQVIRIPMRAESRSLNLSNSVAVIVFEACRQLQFDGLQ